MLLGIQIVLRFLHRVLTKRDLSKIPIRKIFYHQRINSYLIYGIRNFNTDLSYMVKIKV